MRDERKLSPVAEGVVGMVGTLGWPGFLKAVAEVADVQGEHFATVGQDVPLARALHIIRRDATVAAQTFPKGV